jgi:hypothetical protein
MATVAADDIRTWPAPVRERCKQLALFAERNPEYVSDLNLDTAGEDEFRARFRSHRVIAFHATRLLPHELESISTVGLRQLTPDLMEQKIDDAARHGFLSDSERARFHQAHVFSSGEHLNREARVCFFLSEKTMKERSQGLVPLLLSWGGEAIKMSSKGHELRARLRELGQPTIVVAAIRLDEGRNVHSVWPGMQEAFLGRWLRINDTDADVHYRSDVPGEFIRATWVPGDPNYDRFPDLPLR